MANLCVFFSACIIDVIIKQLAQRLLKTGGIVGKIVHQFQNIQEDVLHRFPDKKTSPKHPRIHRPHLTLNASTLGATPGIASSWGQVPDGVPASRESTPGNHREPISKGIVQ